MTINDWNKLSTEYVHASTVEPNTRLGKTDLDGEVTLSKGVICTVEYNLGLSQGDCKGQVFFTSEVTVR